MTDQTPNADLSPPNPDQTGHTEHTHHHSSQGHHRHSHHHHRSSGDWFRNFGRTSRPGDRRSNSSNLRKTESLLAKHFLKIAGILFLLGAAWVIIGIYHPVEKIGGSINPITIAGNVTAMNPANHLPLATLIILLSLFLFSITVLMLSLRIKSIELELAALCIWIFTGLWWGYKYLETWNSGFLYGFIIAATLVYLSFSSPISL